VLTVTNRHLPRESLEGGEIIRYIRANEQCGPQLKRRRHAFAGVLILIVFHAAAFAQQQIASESVADLLSRGYALLEKDPQGALPLFEKAVRADSTHLLARRQLGSLYLALGRPDDALREFRIAHQLFPSDTTGIQIAYLLNGLNRNEEARLAFAGVAGSSDSSIAASARTAEIVLALQSCADRAPWWWRVYASPYFEGRFDDWILLASLTGGRYLNERRTLSVYGTAAVAADSRSSGGLLPVIYSDHYVLLGAGVRFLPLRGLTVDLQTGYTHATLTRAGESPDRIDLRAVATYGAGIYPDLQVPAGFATPLSPFADVYASAGWYSRYENVLGYFQGRAGVRALAYRASALDVYARANLTADTEREFYNNTVEAGLGILAIPDHRWGLSLTIEVLRGTYLGPQSLNPRDRFYGTARIILSFDRFLCW
jgi:hypothetical protein